MHTRLARGITVMVMTAFLFTSLAAPVMASGDGGGRDSYREAIIFAGLGKTIATGSTPGELLIVAHLYVQTRIHALAAAVYAGPLVLGQLEQLTGKAVWTAAVYMAVFGVFYRQIMLQLMSPYMHPLFVVWCMLLYMITATNTFATE